MRHKSFSNTVIDKGEIEQSLLNVDNRTRSNLFSWNGQFSPQFVETLIKKYTLPEYRILDPFLGSGTTLYECAQLNLDVTGVELNPSAFHIAKIYELCNKPLQIRNDLINQVKHIIENNSVNILSCLNMFYEKDLMTVLSLLIIMMDGNTNIEQLYRLWGKLSSIIADFPFCTQRVQAYNGDARDLDFNDDSFDLVFTSPPYINVYNYHQQYRKAVEKLGYNVLLTATAEIGSNRKNRKNRFYTVIQYCIDIALAIREIVRVTKGNKRIILIVGRCSKVLGIDFFNSKLVYDIITKIFDLTLIIRQERFFQNRYGETIYEDILHFRNNKKNSVLDEGVIKNAARKIAQSYFEQIIATCAESETQLLLQDAISCINHIRESSFYIAKNKQTSDVELISM